MSIPVWVLDLFGVVMILVAEVSAGQLAAGRAWTRPGGTGADTALSALLTGIATAGLLVPGLSILPDAAWEGVFAALTAWFAWCLGREGQGRGPAAAACGPRVPYLVHSAALLYVFAAAANPSMPDSGMSMPGMAGLPGSASGSSGGLPTLPAPTLALIFVLLLIALTVLDLDRRAGGDGYSGCLLYTS